MILLEAEKSLQLIKAKFTIIGIKSDGVRGIPPTYNIGVVLANEENICEMLRGFDQVRVFEMTETGDSHDWLKKRNDYFAAKTVKEEKELLQVLKERYEGDS